MSRAHAQARLRFGLIALPSSGFPQGCCGKVENPAGATIVKRSDYITNSVRCQGTVIFLNKMKGESGRPEPVEKLAQPSFFLCQNELI